MNPALACIGGHSAWDLLRNGAFVAERLGPRETPFGPSQPVYLCQNRYGQFYFLARHGEDGIELVPGAVNYRANVFALKELGVRAVVSWSETRAINHNFKIGEYVIASDLIDETHSRGKTFFEHHGLGDVRQWPVFCPSLVDALVATLDEEGGCTYADHGVYVCVEGPRRETPAEARKYASYGGELLGNTLAPEVFLARELQLCYASLCYVSAYAENGSDFRPFENGRVLELDVQERRSREAVERFPRILERLCAVLKRLQSSCPCDAAMRHHIESGRIDPDWRSWFREAADSGNGKQDRRGKAVASQPGNAYS